MIADSSGLIFTAALTGLLGSSHCAGMCGGISAALSFALPTDYRRGARFFQFQLAYNIGRLLTYALLGLGAGALAHGASGGWSANPWPRLAAALMMVLLGLYLAGWSSLMQRLESLGGRLWSALAPLRKNILPVDNPVKALLSGMMWGLLPCGLVYSTLTLAITSSEPVLSSAIMVAFGLGTLPMMLLTGTMAARMRNWLQSGAIRQASGLCIVLFGIWTAWTALPGSSHSHVNHETGMHAMPATSPPGQNSTPEHSQEHAGHHMPGHPM